MKNFDLGELLKGCVPVKDEKGNIVIQSILNMQVVCLTTEDEYSMDDKFADPLKTVKASNNSYGEITFNNRSSKDVITLPHTAILTKQRAQNHGMTKAGYVPKHKTVRFEDAGCVQGSQGGYFSSIGGDEFRVMPVTIREMLFNTMGSGIGDYSTIYSAIRKLGNQTNSNTGEYLNKYFEKYDSKLEQFIAHFERPEKLIGTIVFVDGEIVAIDKYPSFTYAEQVWDVMIRDCYGALAIVSELKDKKGEQLFTKTFDKLSSKSHEENVVDLIEKALKKTKKKMSKSITDRINEIMDVTFEAELDTVGNPNSGSIKSYKIDSEGYIGQVITESDFHYLVSLVKKESFNPDALRVVTELKKKANTQNRFKL